METIETLREKLAKAGDKKTADSQRRTVKSSLSFHGTKRGAFNKIVAEFVDANQSLISLTPLYSLLVNLWKSNNFEERLFALQLLLGFRGLLGEREWVLLSDWADTLDNWVLADWTGHVRAWLLRRYPERVSTLIQWCSAENPWKRRSAVVSVLIHEPEGGGPSQLAVPARQALRVAEAALLDRDPSVQRATAWIVREIARDVPEHAARLLDQYKWKAPKSVLRASADGLPERLRKELLEAMEKPEPPPPPPPPVKGKKGRAAAAKPGGPAPKGGPAKTGTAAVKPPARGKAETAPAKPPARGKGAPAKPGARPKAAAAKPKRSAPKKPSKASKKGARAGGRSRPAAKKPKGSARPKGKAKARRPAGKKRASRSTARRSASRRPSSGARRPKPPGRRHR